MRLKRIVGTATFVGAMAMATAATIAQDAAKKPHVPLEKAIGQVTATGPVPSLAVINSAGAALDGRRLVLTGVSKNSIVFADRPVRAAGHVTTEQFIKQWDEGKDNFAIDPPNATISTLGGDGSDVNDAVVILKAPKLEGNTLTFDIVVLEGNLNNASGPAALFVDAFAFRGPGGGGFAHFGGYGGAVWHGGGYGYHGGAYWHAPIYHGAWYGAGAVAGAAVAGAAIGAAAAAPYAYPPYCGYYPYPPCY